MPADNILFVNTASVGLLDATGSNINGVSFFGTASVALSSVSASWAPSGVSAVAISSSWASASISASFASKANTASYFSMFPSVKSGVISASLFTGNPLTVTASFAIPFPNTNYAISIIGGDARSWTVEFVSASNFTISTNSKQALTDYVRWTAIGTGESS